MYITIDETDSRALYQQVVDEIKALIVRGELEEGSSLPPVRQVAADFVTQDTAEHLHPKLMAALTDLILSGLTRAEVMAEVKNALNTLSPDKGR